MTPDEAADLLMTIWPGSTASRADGLSIALSWSAPLTQLVDANGVDVGSLRLALHETGSEITVAVIDSLAIDALKAKVADDHRGTQAEAVFTTFIDLAQLPHDILVNLISDGILTAISAAIGSRASRVQRNAGSQTLTVKAELSPRYLAVLAMTHAAHVYGVRPTSEPTWSVLLKSDPSFVSGADGRWFNYLINVVDYGHEFVYQLAPDGEVTSHTVDGLAQSLPRIDGRVDPDADWKAPSDVQEEMGYIVSLNLDVDVATVSADQWEPFADYRKLLLRDVLSSVVLTLVQELPDAGGGKALLEVPAVELQDRPPRADGLFPTVFTELGPVIEYIKSTTPQFMVELAVGELLITLAKRLKSRIASQGLPEDSAQVGFNRVGLETLCVAYVRRHYHPRAHLDVFTIPFNRQFDGYDFPVDPDLPTGWRVAVTSSKALYSFVVDGSMRARELTVRRGAEVEHLYDIDMGIRTTEL